MTLQMADNRQQNERLKYGVPVATRIDADDADRIAKKCEQSGIVFSKYIRILIERALKNDDTVLSLQKKIEELQADNKNITGKFISEIAGNNQQKIKDYVQTYNRIKYEYTTSKGGLQF
jgi:predicted DNA binding CopG/RHH family protein